MIRAILFDKDGTLFDFAATWEAWAASFLLRATAGDQTRAAEIGHHIGFDLPNRRFAPDSIVIAGTPGEVADALMPHFPEAEYDAFLAMLNEEAEKAPQAETVPLAPFLDDLRGRGLTLGVMTNDSEEVAHAHLGQSGVRDRFSFIAGFDSGFGAKPAPDPLLAFCRAVGVNPAHALMVGDSTHDLIAGRRAGMRTVGVLTGMADTATLAPHADCVLPHIGHLTDWLDDAER
ncbi:HAD family hydrolase [Aestuariivita boseongensis]|uniref:HAD family hydrolase n=1 Tax=Aestuariivita boseongensis TaxID=1470562 RepID=UPI000AA0B376|nr:HAD family hydrolase [Aestuariivita boseongensis]